MNRSLILIIAAMAAPMSVRGATIYSNDFESNSTGFTNSGAIPALTRTSLPTDGGGLASPNQSTWLGRIGEGIAKSTTNEEIVELTVTGLVSGQVYTVAFDLLVGASWDGAAGGYGWDEWFFSVDGVRKVDTCFSNGDQGIDYGAYSPQRYTDTNYAVPTGTDVAAYTGAEYSKKAGPGYSGYYGIYYFSHGTGNPVLTFTATGTTATLRWERLSTNGAFGDSGDEYWALDNVVVTGAAAPACDGDASGDGQTTVADFNIIATNFNSGPGKTRAQGDLTGDGFVTVADFLVLVGDIGCGT